MRLGVLIVAVLGLGVMPLVSGCGSSSSSSSSTESSSSDGGTKSIAGVQANDHGTKTASSSGKTEVELDDFYFEPTVLQGKPGTKVELELKNEGTEEHTFTIDSENVDQELQPGDEAEVTVTIPKSGAVSFYCKLHKSSGMAGALAVSDGTGGMTDTGGDTTTGGGGY
jgi:plastocyanin